MQGYNKIFRGGVDENGHFIGGEFHADDCNCGDCESTYAADMTPNNADVYDAQLQSDIDAMEAEQEYSLWLDAIAERESRYDEPIDYPEDWR